MRNQNASDSHGFFLARHREGYFSCYYRTRVLNVKSSFPCCEAGWYLWGRGRTPLKRAQPNFFERMLSETGFSGWRICRNQGDGSIPVQWDTSHRLKGRSAMTRNLGCTPEFGKFDMDERPCYSAWRFHIPYKPVQVLIDAPESSCRPPSFVPDCAYACGVDPYTHALLQAVPVPNPRQERQRAERHQSSQRLPLPSPLSARIRAMRPRRTRMAGGCIGSLGRVSRGLNRGFQ